jgi:hypothetical protein
LLERERERERQTEMGRVLLLLLLWTYELKLWKTFVLGHVTESHINSQGAAACEICIHNHCEKCSLGGCDICLPTAACKLPQIVNLLPLCLFWHTCFACNLPWLDPHVSTSLCPTTTNKKLELHSLSVKNFDPAHHRSWS